MVAHHLKIKAVDNLQEFVDELLVLDTRLSCLLGNGDVYVLDDAAEPLGQNAKVIVEKIGQVEAKEGQFAVLILTFRQDNTVDELLVASPFLERSLFQALVLLEEGLRQELLVVGLVVAYRSSNRR